MRAQSALDLIAVEDSDLNFLQQVIKPTSPVRMRRSIMQTWQMQVAKARLSEVVKRAEHKRPAGHTMHARSVAVMVSRAEFDRLAGTGE